jgi:predicted phosphodiesterase
MNVLKARRDNILVIGDTHFPFEHPHYLEFVRYIKDRCKCQRVVHIGDLVDNHSISYHEHDPNGKSPADEMEEVDRKLSHWFAVFPNIYLCRGNHDRLVDRKGRTSGLPERVFMPFRQIWNLPKGWRDDWEWVLDGVIFKHGTNLSGKYAHVQASYDNRQSTVIGHTHSAGGVEYTANQKGAIFGMNVGCGIDVKSYAFAYGKDAARKPVLGCGIVTDHGKYAQFFPME